MANTLNSAMDIDRSVVGVCIAKSHANLPKWKVNESTTGPDLCFRL